MDTFTNRFNEILKIEQINQANLANKIGIARQCITDYKSGKSFPTIQTLARICNTLEISSDYLLGLEDDFGTPTTAPISDGRSSEELRLLEIYRNLSSDMKATLWSLLDTWSPSTAQSKNKV